MKETFLNVSMWIVTLCTYISYTPQIVQLLKTKKSEDLSISSWVLFTVSSIANLAYSVVLGRAEFIISSVSEVVMILSVLLLTVYYRHK